MNGFRASPIMPARDLDETFAFYEQLGFVRFGNPYDAYLMVTREAWELHFFLFPEVDPSRSIAGTYLRCHDVDAISEEWRALDLPSEGRPRFMPAEDKDWGMRELAVIDPNGNLLRVGQF